MYRKIFNNKHTILPVIHAKDDYQIKYNAEIAFKAGADGVWLINHEMSAVDLIVHAQGVTKLYPEWFIGINCLDKDPEYMLNSAPYDIKGVWSDNAYIYENSEKQERASEIHELLKVYQQQGTTLYFGGVAFKYQKPVSDCAKAAKIAKDYVDVVVTSGLATGEAADLDKIIRMKEAVGSFPLAVASGITPENVKAYLPYTDCFMVATGVSKNFHEFDPVKLEKLIEVVRNNDS